MTYDNNNTEVDFIPKRVKPRYITINEDIFQTLDPDSLKVYMTLRFESDYNTECSSVKKNIKFIINKVNLSRRQVFYCISVIEKHGLLKRESNPGFQSTYWVAQDLNYFSPKTPNLAMTPSKKIDQIDRPPVHEVHGVVHEVHGVVHHMHNITNITSNITSKRSKTLVDSNESTSVEPIAERLSEISFEQKDIVDSKIDQKIDQKKLVDFKKSTDYKTDQVFMSFYSIYPNKEKPSVARVSFYKLKPTHEFVEMLISDVKKRINGNWKGRDKSKIPHPATYLNQRQWEGEIYQNSSNQPNKAKIKTWDEIINAEMGIA